MKVYKENPIIEITLRKFEKPYEEGDALIRKFCISIGLLQPGDSRDTIVGILKLLLKNKETKVFMDSKEIWDIVKDGKEIAHSNVRRHLNRMEKLGLVERYPQGYRIKEWLSLTEIIKEFVEKFVINQTLDRIKEYTLKIDSLRF